jgi:hypothetical protein
MTELSWSVDACSTWRAAPQNPREIPDWDIERLADFIERARADAVLAPLAFLHFLKWDAELFA